MGIVTCIVFRRCGLSWMNWTLKEEHESCVLTTSKVSWDILIDWNQRY